MPNKTAKTRTDIFAKLSGLKSWSWAKASCRIIFLAYLEKSKAIIPSNKLKALSSEIYFNIPSRCKKRYSQNCRTKST